MIAMYPHVPAAFINAIAEEGTRAEAVEWLQRQWNETCVLRAALEVCAADWISAPGTVLGAAQGLLGEFRRRAEIAEAALRYEGPSDV